MLKSILLIGAGGAVGSIFRYVLSLFIGKFANSNFPWPTLIINILGCLLIGVLMGIFARDEVAYRDLKLLLVTGLCGGFTTFSAFAFENVQMLQNGNYLNAVLYMIASVVVCLFAVIGGLYLSK